MFLSNRVKSFLTLTFFVVVSGACGFGPASTGNGAVIVEPIRSELPFSTREPEKYSADIVISMGNTHRRIRVFRNGKARRYDYDIGEKNQLSVIRSDRYLRLLPGRKVFCEDAGRPSLTETADDPLTISLLHNKTFTQFQEVGNDENLIRYEAKHDSSSLTRAVIFFDKTIGLPVRQEFYSLEGDDEVLQYTMELQNFETTVDETVFRVPPDYRKVSTDEFTRLLRQ